MTTAPNDPIMAARPRRLLPVLLTRTDFLVSIAVGVLALASLYYWLLLKVSTLETAWQNMAAEPAYLAVVTVLAPVTLLLFGFNFALSLLLFRAGTGFRWQSGSLLGAFTGSFGAACPVCGAFLLSLLGVTGGLTVLPFAGLELWAASTGLMALAFGGSLRALAKKTCDGDVQTGSCWRLPAVDLRFVAVLLLVSLALLLNLYSMLRGNEVALLVEHL